MYELEIEGRAPEKKPRTTERKRPEITSRFHIRVDSK
jgi:hypothetical protein